MRNFMILKGAIGMVLAAVLANPMQAFCASYHSSAHMLEGDDETILVEKAPPSQKIPYSTIVRKIGKRFFDFDTYNVLTYTHSKETGIARTLSDYMARSKYRLNVKQDEFELKYSLSF